MVSLGDMSSQQLQQLAVSADSMMSQNWTWVRLYGPNPTRHTQMTRPNNICEKNPGFNVIRDSMITNQ